MCKNSLTENVFLFIVRSFKEYDPTTKEVDKKREVCGMLHILPNGEMYQRKIKIFFIRVKTKINGKTISKGKWSDNAKKIFSDVLEQALVIPEIVTTRKDGSDLIVDTTNPKSKKNKGINFRDEFCILDDDTEYVIDEKDASKKNKGQKMRDYFFNELEEIDNNEYKNAFKIFFIDKNVNSGTIGYSWDQVTPYVVCFNTTKDYDTVITHEILHALELAHPFDAYSRNTLFSHHFCTTDNVMDYTQSFRVTETISIFHRQWQLINTKIRQTMKNRLITFTIALLLTISCYAQKNEKNTNMEKYDFEAVKNAKRYPVGIKRNGKTILILPMTSSGASYSEYPDPPSYYRIGKGFYPNGSLKVEGKVVGRGLVIGESIYYDEKGNVTKRVDEDAKFANAKIKVEDILKFLEKEGYIDLKTGRGLGRGIIHENGWGEKEDAGFDMGLMKEGDKEYWYVMIYWSKNGNTEVIYHIDKDTGEVLHKESNKVYPIM